VKCIFAATTYQFSVQYHPWMAVAARGDSHWLMSIDGFPALYTMLPEPGSDRQSDETCAVFVPARLDAVEASLLVSDFKSAHPGVIPGNTQFEYVTRPWWKRAPRAQPIPSSPMPGDALTG